jgi:hypothetical protein
MSSFKKSQMNFNVPMKFLTTFGRDFVYDAPWICPAKKKISKELIKLALAKKMEEIIRKNKDGKDETKK